MRRHLRKIALLILLLASGPGWVRAAEDAKGDSKADAKSDAKSDSKADGNADVDAFVFSDVMSRLVKVIEKDKEKEKDGLPVAKYSTWHLSESSVENLKSTVSETTVVMSNDPILGPDATQKSALSLKTEQKILVYRNLWRTVSTHFKVRLDVHHYLVIAGMEPDDKYQLTDQILDAFDTKGYTEALLFSPETPQRACLVKGCLLEVEIGSRYMGHYNRAVTLTTPPDSLGLEVQATLWPFTYGGAYIAAGAGFIGTGSFAFGGGLKIPFLQLIPANHGLLSGMTWNLVVDVLYYSIPDPTPPFIYDSSGVIPRYGASIRFNVFNSRFNVDLTMMATSFSGNFFIAPLVGVSTRL